MDKANPKNFWQYNGKLREYANSNRKNMTKAEACLWKFVLSRSQMQGFPFRRQRPILNYIADFMCKDLMLIIEVDGLTHEWEEIEKNDKLREQALTKIGFTVLRFSDDDVLSHINHVIYKIEEYIQEFQKKENQI